MNKLLFILFFLITACLPQESGRTSSRDNQSTDQSGTDVNGENNSGTTTPTQGLNPLTQWHLSGSSSSQIQLSNTFNDSVFLRGGSLDAYLNSLSTLQGQSFCVVLSFQQVIATTSPITYAPRQLRVKASPFSFYNYDIQAFEKTLRVDFQEQAVSALHCQGANTALGSVFSDANSNVVYSLGSLCPNCLSPINASEVKIYGTQLQSTTRVLSAPVDIQASGLSFSYNINSNSSGGSSNSATCSQDQECPGFQTDKCCIQGQCVQHGADKLASQQANPTEFAAVSALVNINPVEKLNYPQYYYICSRHVNTTPTDGVSGGNQGADLTQLYSDHLCLQELKQYSLSYPYVQNLNTNMTSCNYTNPSASNYCSCHYSDPNQDNYYLNVLNRMAQTCCSSSTSYNNCLQEYSVTMNSSGQPTQVNCQALTAPSTDPTQDVYLSSRTAPHRLFDQTGQNYSSLSQLPPGAQAEGEEFEYVDSLKLMPNNGEFNMNSLLGQFDISLNQARPALVLDVQVDSTYMVKPKEGSSSFYSHCEDCGPDSWHQLLSPFPKNLNWGWGLMAQGFTTRRDLPQNNASQGNYEDTIFGRACWVPPTMIAYGHSNTGVGSVQEQREHRLKTQAALYINGYQRDWYGFNRGALIASFDGVKWFALGDGRIVKATSNKLFLAINSPYADLAEINDIEIRVRPYNNGETGAHFDYDPSLSYTHPNQNKGASCQAWHQCEVDSDCITRLGWEYSCAEVTRSKTRWPRFNVEAEEQLGSKDGSITQILQGETLPGSSIKRCVYRGAGSLCSRNLQAITSEKTRKLLTCAPNFYCADPDDTVFNTEVARSAQPIDQLAFMPRNHFFGQEANQLGRPLTYISSNLSALPSQVKQTLEENLSLIQSSIGSDVGVCRPGKRLPTDTNFNNYPSLASAFSNNPSLNPLYQHDHSDSDERVDFISQIGSVDTENYTESRFMACPVLDEDGNYIHTTNAFKNLNEATLKDFKERSIAQNASARESLDSAYSFPYDSPFNSIEWPTLLSSSTIMIEKSLAQHACFRRAGSVCHTDLDCSPNRMISALGLQHNVDVFGNLAEKKYWEEELICAQAQAAPFQNLSNLDLSVYDMGQNRCCRETGKELTIYTSYSNETQNWSTPVETEKLSFLNPEDPSRYSRLSNVKQLSTDPTLDQPQALSAEVDKTGHIYKILHPNQWKTVQESAKRTCCGRQFVRQFADGTNDWSQNRWSIDVSNFSCLNYQAPYVTMTAAEYVAHVSTQFFSTVSASVFNWGQPQLCQDTTTLSGTPSGGSYADCIQVPLKEAESFDDITPPAVTEDDAFLNDSDPNYYKYNAQFQYPLSLNNQSTFTSQIPYAPLHDGVRGYFEEFSPTSTTGISHIKTDKEVKIRRPVYLTDPNILTNVQLVSPAYYDETDATWKFFASADMEDFYPHEDNACVYRGTNPSTTLTSNDAKPCSYWITDQFIVIRHHGYFNDDPSDVNDDGAAHSIFNSLAQFNTGTSTNVTGFRLEVRLSFRNAFIGNSLSPASSMYYLRRLGRLELSGIPQIYYEPLYCSNNPQKLVPGIFDGSIQTRNDFETSNPNTFDPTQYSNYSAIKNNFGEIVQLPWTDSEGSQPAVPNRTVATSSALETPTVFAENKFKCCLELGSITSSAGNCCSGHAGGTPLNCQLPGGADLNVYFNRFVSSEGVGENLPSGGLVDDDFNPYTGEPKLEASVMQKLVGLGQQFCSSGKVRRGGAFGKFVGQPDGDVYYKGYDVFSIVDDSNDYGTTTAGTTGSGATDVGYMSFAQGYRWNHHVYCDGN